MSEKICSLPGFTKKLECCTGEILKTDLIKNVLLRPWCKDVMILGKATHTKITYNKLTLFIKGPQFLANLYLLNKTNVLNFVAHFEKSISFAYEVMDVCMIFVLAHIKGEIAKLTPKDRKELNAIGNIVSDSISVLKAFDFNAKIPLPDFSECFYAKTEAITLAPVLAAAVSTECALTAQINSLKFPKPKSMGEGVHSPTGLDLFKVIRNMTNTMDNFHCTDKINYHNKLIKESCERQRSKYKQRALKVSKRKIEFNTAGTVSLNTFDDGRNDNFMYLMVKIKGNSFKFLIDSGAIVSFIHSDLVYGSIRPTDIRISTAGAPASNHNVVGKSDLEFQVECTQSNAYHFLHEFVVVRDLNGYAGILGQDLLSLDLSQGLDFKGEVWNILLNNEVVSIPYSCKRELNVCSAYSQTTLEPKETRVIKVNCTGLVNNFKSVNFITENTAHASLEIAPSLSKVSLDDHKILATHILVSNKLNSPFTISAGTQLCNLVPHSKDSDKELEIPDEAFLTALESKSLNHIVTAHCVSKYEKTHKKPDPDFVSCVQTLSLNNFKTTTDVVVECNNLSVPSIDSFNEYTRSLDECTAEVGVNKREKNTDATITSQEGYRENLSKIEKDTPELILPDDYINEINQEISTIIVDSFSENEKETYKDVDLTHIPEKFRPKYEALLEKYSHIFSQHSWDIGETDLLTVKLDVIKTPVTQKQRQIPQNKLKFVEQAVAELEDAKIIKKVNSWNSVSNLILVPKYKSSVRYNTKAESLRADPDQIKAYRICVDLRNLNEVLAVKASSLSVPPEHIIMPLANRLVTNMDVRQAYFSIKLHPDSQILTAFFVNNAVYVFRRLSQGLLSSPRAYEVLNNLVYEDTILPLAIESAHNPLDFPPPSKWEEILKCFQDDSWCHSPMNYDHHLYILAIQLYALARSGLKLSPKKCVIASTKVRVLGLEVDTKDACLSMDILKAQSILSWTDPTSLYELHSRLFSLLYYSKFLPKIKELTLPLQELLRNNKFEWGAEQKSSWEQIKALIILDIRMYIPTADEQLYLFTDASKISCASILFTEIQGSLRVVGCDSTVFNYGDSLKSPFIKESISLIRGLKKFSNYIGASKKTLRVFTDCKSLLYVSRKKEYDIASYNISNILLYYQLLYRFDIFHITGQHNVYADLCSRAFANSRLLSDNKYNMSKKQAEILPPLTTPFVIDGDTLFDYLQAEPQAEVIDSFSKEKRGISTPRPLKNLITLFENATSEEKWVSGVRLLNGWNDKSIDSIAYTDRLNKKLGLNNITKEYFVDHPAIICSHPNFSRSGDLLTTQDLLLPPQASHLFSDLLLLKANVLVDFKSRTESLYVELTPVKPNEYEIRVYNPTSSQITINQGDVVGMIVSNIKARVHRMNRANFEHTTLNKYVLPISGLRVSNWNRAPTNLELPNRSLNNLSLEGESTTEAEPSVTHQRAYIAHNIIENNYLTKEVFIELQAEDEFCMLQAKNTQNKHFELREGILHKISQQKGRVVYLTVIPECLLEDVLAYIHSNYAHPSLSSFLSIFSSSYYYPGIRALIKLKINKCVVCAKVHLKPNHKICRGVARSFNPVGPRTSISVDIIPKLNRTSEDNEAILLIVDNYSGYGSGVLLKNKSADNISNALKNYFLMMKAPLHIYSDGEASIIAACRELQNYFDFYLQTSPSDSQHRNRAEKLFKDLKGIIRRVLYDPKNGLKSPNWDIALVHALNIYNSLPLSKCTALNREFIHFHATVKSIPLAYCEEELLSSQDITDMLHAHRSKLVENYAKDKEDKSTWDLSPNQIIFCKAPPLPSQKSTFAISTRGPFIIDTVDFTTKTVTARLYKSKTSYYIAFENINKIQVNEVDLDLFDKFLSNKHDRDFSMRPRPGIIPDPLHTKRTSQSVPSDRILRSSKK